MPEPALPVRVLVVEDEALIRRVMMAGVDREAELVGVASAPLALARLQTERFDVILCDVELGEGLPTGHWLLAEVARRWPHVRRYLMSATKQTTTEAFLLKPVPVPVLLDILREAGASR